MYSHIRLLVLALIFIPLIAEEQPVFDYQVELESAIVQSNAAKVTRLLKRRNRTSVKNFNHLLGWANDTIEERRMLEHSSDEVVATTFATVVGVIGSIAALSYYFDAGTFRSDVRETFIGEEKGFFTLLALSGILCSYGEYKGWSGPYKRLAKSYEILFAIEDVVDAMEKKRKAHAMMAKKRSLRSKRIL